MGIRFLVGLGIEHWTLGIGFWVSCFLGGQVKSAVKCNWFSRWLAAPGILAFWHLDILTFWLSGHSNNFTKAATVSIKFPLSNAHKQLHPIRIAGAWSNDCSAVIAPTTHCPN